MLSKLAEWGRDPEQAYLEMMNRGLLGGMLEVTPLVPVAKKAGQAVLDRFHIMGHFGKAIDEVRAT